MGKTKTTTAELAVIEPVRVELIIPEEIEINGLKISNKIIQDKIAEVKLMKISGTDDKAGYDAAVKAKSECVKLRTQSEAWRKDNTKPINDALSKLKALIDGFGKEAQVGETYLDSIIKPIDDAKEKIKKDKEEAKLKVMQGRISEIMALGGQFDGLSVYTFPYDPGLLINAISLKDWEIGEFSEFLEEVKTSWVCEQERIANEQAEADRKAQELADQAEANKVQEKANQDKRTALRLKELKLMGFVLYLGQYVNDTTADAIAESQIINTTDENWDIVISNIQERIDEASLPQIAEPEVTPEVDLPEIEPEHVGGYMRVPVSSPDELDRIGEVTVPVDYSNMVYKCELRFEPKEPFKEIDISKSFKLRLYPAELSDLNVVDPKVIATEGEIDPASSLRYMLIKK